MIGIIPAAGHATRINGLPKFLLPVPGDSYLLDILCRRMTQAGAHRLLVATNTRNAELVGRYLPADAWLVERDTSTMSETVLNLRTAVGNDAVLFGMPDSWWSDEYALIRLAEDIQNGALVSVALFETRPEQRSGLGMCEIAFDLDEQLTITRVVDKPSQTTLRWAWGALAWSAEFWAYLDRRDAHVGFGLQRAIEAGRKVLAYLAYGSYFDCGTPRGFFDLIMACHTQEQVR